MRSIYGIETDIALYSMQYVGASLSKTKALDKKIDELKRELERTKTYVDLHSRIDPVEKNVQEVDND